MVNVDDPSLHMMNGGGSACVQRGSRTVVSGWKLLPALLTNRAFGRIIEPLFFGVGLIKAP
ncbi:hypothetical protein ABIB34_004208 [Rhodococcus sp. UYP5]